MKNPRTARVLAKAESTRKIRFSTADRAFLQDLSKALIIDEETADKWHYSDRQSGARRRLDKLTEAGILERVEIGGPKGLKKVTAWQFASKEVSRVWGGDVPGVGANRSYYHELLAGRSYFELGRPLEFRLSCRFNASDKVLFGGVEPDAIAKTATGEIVLIEADTGHYTKQQIRQKQDAWGSHKQLWIQPKKAMARITECDRVSAIRV